MIVQFAQNILNAGQIIARVVQAVFSFAATLFVLGYACGFLEKHAQFFGFGFNDARNHTLPDNRIRARPQARAHENILHIAAAHLLVVDVITRTAIAREHTTHRDFGVLSPLTARATLGIVKHQFDRRTRGGFAITRAIKNHIGHGFTAQLGRTRLAKHPARRIHDV